MVEMMPAFGPNFLVCRGDTCVELIYLTVSGWQRQAQDKEICWSSCRWPNPGWIVQCSSGHGHKKSVRCEPVTWEFITEGFRLINSASKIRGLFKAFFCSIFMFATIISRIMFCWCFSSMWAFGPPWARCIVSLLNSVVVDLWSYLYMKFCEMHSLHEDKSICI